VTTDDAKPSIPGLRLRPATPADWGAIADIINAANRGDGLDEVQSAEQIASELPDSADFQLGRDLHIAEVGGLPVGFAIGRKRQRDETITGETWAGLRPEWRRRGIGSALFARTREALAPLLDADPRPWPRELRSYALDSQRADIALLTAEGFVPIRYGFEMRRPLTSALPVHPLPGGLVIRPVVERDHRAVFDADVEAFQDHWGHTPGLDSDFVARFNGPEIDTSLWCVAWDGDQVAGVVMNAISHEENDALGVQRGWLDRVSVRRPWRGLGVGKALCAASFAVLRERGMTEAWLGVDGANPTGALRLYEGLGFNVARRWQAYGRPLDAPAPAGWRCASDRATMGA
jgi:ribosomal protein S18 acetylase RimI-like enzyme